ncbi:MAG TPA: protease pro-enzyme activation domain-containing protein [Candidatus Dormibacteraeota bacterium]|nr:protease pro-enzyme activation domain-containing protein [Candidatus Dormibacteraeota bacterium]
MALRFGISASAQTQVLHGHVPAAVSQLTPTGRVPGEQHLKLAIGLPVRDPAALDTLLSELYDPSSPDYHQWRTPSELAQRFGTSEQDYAAVKAWAQSKRLAVLVEHSNRLVLDVEGTVANIEKALHIMLRVYNHPTENRTFFAPDNDPSLDLSTPILTIDGLDTFSLPHPKHREQQLDSRASPRSGSGPSGTYRGSDFRAAYLPGVALTGTGQTVGLLQFDGYYTNDITTYETQAGLPNVPLTNVPIDGGVSTPGSGNSEVCLDIEMVVSMAPGVSRIYVYEAPNPSPWVDLLSRMQTDNLSKQLSCSWGGGSPNATAENIFKLMGAQGQSFYNATGDSDAFTGSITFPSDSTNITQVGGTTLTTTGPGGSYVSEQVWNWGLVQGSYVGSSGGISTYYKMPSYQTPVSMALNQGSATMRNVPDVALTADNVYVIYNNGGTGAFGGTSCAAPLWAGLTALINQQAVSNGVNTVGSINPAIYNVGLGANYSSNFHDVTVGDNTWPSSPTKFYATNGYDLCTGWGTPIGPKLITTLAGAPGPSLVSNSLVLTFETCSNGVVDPGETVTLNFGLKNAGSASTTNLVATLLNGGGIISPSGAQTYGALPVGSIVSRPFTFTANGSCGGTAMATLQLNDGAANLGTITFTLPLGTTAPAAPLSQNFDIVSAPALPVGWTTALLTGSQTNWVTSAASSSSAPNSAFIADSPNSGENALVSPVFFVASANAKLTFQQSYNLETKVPKHGAMTYYDGGVLEIKIGSSAFTDILTAGGSFVSGGYNVTLATGNPIAGRQAWGGDSAGWVTTTLNLPPAAAGQNIQFRWVCAVDTDNANGGFGWYVDSISLSDTVKICCTGAADVGIRQTVNPSPSFVGGNLTYTLAITNMGPGTASSVTVTDALPAGVTFLSASPGCTNYGSVVAWTLGSLSAGGQTNINITVAPLGAGSFTNYSTVSLSGADPNMSNNSMMNVLKVLISPHLTGLTLAAGSVSISVPSISGLSYTLEYKNALTDSSWTAIAPTVTGTGSLLLLQDTNSLPDSRFYRVRSE